MSDLSTTPTEAASDVVDQHTVEQQALQTTPVITTHHVAFSTAAAAGVPRQTLISRFAAAFRRSEVTELRAPRPYPPRRPAFLEEAAMQREMRHL